MARKKLRKFRKQIPLTANANPEVNPPILGEPSSFSSSPWWISDWWNLSNAGHNNDVISDCGTVGDLAVAAVSLRGNSHRLKGTPCEDSFCISVGQTTEEGFIVAAIGDGVGSAKYSAYGSKKSTSLFVNNVSALLSKEEDLSKETLESIIDQSFSAMRDAVRNWYPGEHLAPELEPSEVSVSELETTLTFAVIPSKPDQGGFRNIYCGFIGDSPIFRLSEKKWLSVPYSEETTDILDSRTKGIQSTETFTLGTERFSDEEVLVLASDGVGNFLSIDNQNLAVGNYLAEQWSSPKSLPQIINDLSFDFRTADDDRTVVICWLNRQQYTQ